MLQIHTGIVSWKSMNEGWRKRLSMVTHSNDDLDVLVVGEVLEEEQSPLFLLCRERPRPEFFCRARL